MITRLLIAGSCLFAAAPAPAEDYFWDFQNSYFDNLSLTPMGQGAVNLLSPTNEGLRITIPEGYDVKAVGFSPRFAIRGDFEVTVDFTILSRSTPKGGFGTGPSLYLSTGSTQDPAASLGRLLRPMGRDVYGLFAARIEEEERVPTAKLYDVPTNSSTSGRLQLRRTNDEITYAVADDRLSPFRDLAVLPMSDGEVTMLRIGVSQSDPQSSAVVVLHSLLIEAAELPHLESEQNRNFQLYRPRYRSPPSPRSYRWLWQLLIALALLSGTATWWWRRRSQA